MITYVTTKPSSSGPFVVTYVVYTSLILVSRQLICVAPFHAFPFKIIPGLTFTAGLSMFGVHFSLGSVTPAAVLTLTLE